MSWTYAAFEEQSTDTARLAMLNQHITEVRQKIGPDVTDGEVSVNRGQLVNYLSALMKRREELEQRVARASNRGPVYVQKRRPGCEYRG